MMEIYNIEFSTPQFLGPILATVASYRALNFCQLTIMPKVYPRVYDTPDGLVYELKEELRVQKISTGPLPADGLML